MEGGAGHLSGGVSTVRVCRWTEEGVQCAWRGEYVCGGRGRKVCSVPGEVSTCVWWREEGVPGGVSTCVWVEGGRCAVCLEG